MKPILSYLLVIILVVSLMFILLAPKAHAAGKTNDLQTVFALIVKTSDGASHTYTNPTPAGERIALPAAYNDIYCSFSETHVDGKDLLRVLSCTDTTATYRSIVSCASDVVSNDSSTIAISPNENDAVFFFLACVTAKKETIKSPHTIL